MRAFRRCPYVLARNSVEQDDDVLIYLLFPYSRQTRSALALKLYVRKVKLCVRSDI